MKTYTIQKEYTAPMLKIEYDEDAESPRTSQDNLGYFITCDKKYHSPDKNGLLESIIEKTGETAKNQKNHIDLIKLQIKLQLAEKVLAIYPVLRYEHNGVSYRLGTVKGCDYSNNGFYIITDKTAKRDGAKKKDWEKIVKKELEIYTQYANGEVYSFILYDQNGEVDETGWDYYDIEDIRESLPKSWAKENLSDYIVK